MKLSELRDHIEEQILGRFGFNGVPDLDPESKDFEAHLRQRVDAVATFFNPLADDAGEIDTTRLLLMLYLLEMGRDTLTELEMGGRLPVVGAPVVPLFPRHECSP